MRPKIIAENTKTTSIFISDLLFFAKKVIKNYQQESATCMHSYQERLLEWVAENRGNYPPSSQVISLQTGVTDVTEYVQIIHLKKVQLSIIFT